MTKYEAVLKAKEFLGSEAMVEIMATYETEKDIAAAVSGIWGKKYTCIPYKVKMAVTVVALCGAWREEWAGGYSFMMPTTRDCLSVWKEVEKAVKKGRKLCLTVYGLFEEDSYPKLFAA